MNEIANWLSTQSEKHMVLGYGSLLSKDSRERYSNIFTPGIPVTVSGFERAWVTRSLHEKQTYVGAVANAHSKLNAQLIPTQINPALQEREKDYRFVEVSAKALNFHQHKGSASLDDVLAQFTFWICETLDCTQANDAYPVHQTYVDTCLSGCLEHGGIEEAERFIVHTSLWEHPRVNDRANPKYPRAAVVNPDHFEHIDRLLAKRQCLPQVLLLAIHSNVEVQKRVLHARHKNFAKRISVNTNTAIFINDKITLRPLTFDDKHWVLALQQDPLWLRYIGSKNVETVDDACDYIGKTNAQREEWGYGLLAVELTETKQPLGVCGLFNRFAFECPDLGFAMLPEARGKGICYEACQCVIAWSASKGYRFLTAMTHPENMASQKLLQRLGFNKQGFYFDKTFPKQHLFRLELR